MTQSWGIEATFLVTSENGKMASLMESPQGAVWRGRGDADHSASSAGRGLPLLPGRQHLHVPGARVRAQHRCSALPVPSAGRLPRPADKGAPAPERAEPQVLCAGPSGRVQEGCAGATRKPETRYLPAATRVLPLPRTVLRSGVGVRLTLGYECSGPREDVSTSLLPFLRTVSPGLLLAPLQMALFSILYL